MSGGVSVKLPLSPDSIMGHYAQNKTFKEATKQNFKNLILTTPGERIMDPDFGVGLLTLLFENKTPFTSQEVMSKIEQQIKIYMPHIQLVDVQFLEPLAGEFAPHTLQMVIKYFIAPLGETDLLDITVE